MSIAILSDIHANLDALDAVLKDIEARGGVTGIYSAGDVVGYGPDPEQCVQKVNEICKGAVAGNHDHGLLGFTSMETSNPIAKEAIEWSQDKVSEEARAIMRSWPMELDIEPGIKIVHANPVSPEKWDYVLSVKHMELTFKHLDKATRICVVGHSHMPFITEMEDDTGRMSPYGGGGGKVFMKDNSRYLVNAGSVGQPRDQKPMAGYALIDDDSIEIVRVEYDVNAMADRMVEMGVHLALAERVRYGF